jgi:hypothetical protein
MKFFHSPSGGPKGSILRGLKKGLFLVVGPGYAKQRGHAAKGHNAIAVSLKDQRAGFGHSVK